MQNVDESKLMLLTAQVDPKSNPWEPVPDAGPITSPRVGTETVALSATGKFLKDLIRVGVYKHPTQHWTLDTSPEREKNWCLRFGEMQRDGIEVPIYADHVASANTHLGYLADMFMGGDTAAFARHPEFQKLPKEKQPLDAATCYGISAFEPGDEKTALRVGRVSVLIDKDFVGGNGKHYGEAIRHVAVTPEPVVAGQEGFVRLAASRNNPDDQATVYVLSSGSTNSKAGASGMTPEHMQLCKDTLAKHLGADHEDVKGLSEDNAIPTVCKHFGALMDAHSGLRTDHANLQGEHDKAKADSADASAKAASRIDELEKEGKLALSNLSPEVLDDLAEGAEERIDSLTMGPKPKITPAVATALKGVLVGSKDSRNAWALSRHVSKTPESVVRGIVKALGDNDVVELGEKTKAQQIALSREVPDDKGADLDPKVHEEMKAKAALLSGAPIK